MWPLIRILPVKTNFRFVVFAKYAAVASVLAAIASLFLALYPLTPPCGGMNCGIDFKGGTLLEISTAPQAVDLSRVRSELGGLELGDVQVQAFGAPSSALVRFQTPEGESSEQAIEEVKAALTSALGEVTFAKTEVVGPKVSGELFQNGLMALGFAIALMLIYIWFRFELQFGVGAVVGLLHDVVLTFGLIALFDLEFSLTSIAAILTIIGYSMNDTVVVFDRMRENIRKYKRMPLGELVDLTINETLSRTIITGLTTILALGALAIFGGPTLFGFSVIMIFGVVIGTYSSIYVAAPIILLWGVKRGEEEAEPLPVRT
ncbi:MAG: protein translocase subunit SecF [Phenylobacterium sp.]|uniref:protein translocase subunit SecF n=1 Tax=Phenylobacterium sp. TaxID=1871053 RepID=UPI002720525F|nr:protein translocase subunit SecF [Phenylobacterium sp.]MDO8409019.1 protein translocase subunit SecF [Phenylobacterium sp.]